MKREGGRKASIIVIEQSLGQSEYLPHFRIFNMLMAKLFFTLIIEVCASSGRVEAQQLSVFHGSGPDTYRRLQKD